MTDSHKTAAHCEREVTPEAISEFQRLFLDWRDSWPTCDQLQAGGTGDLEDLTKRVTHWAATLLRDSRLRLTNRD